MPIISIAMKEDEYEALNYFAEQQMRDPRAQALVIIRNELISRNLIQEKQFKNEESEYNK